MMTAEQAIERIRRTGRCTASQARAINLQVTRGSYQGTTDDRLDRWYVDTIDGPVDRTGGGAQTRGEAYAEIADRVRRGEIDGPVASDYT